MPLFSCEQSERHIREGFRVAPSNNTLRFLLFTLLFHTRQDNSTQPTFPSSFLGTSLHSIQHHPAHTYSLVHCLKSPKAKVTTESRIMTSQTTQPVDSKKKPAPKTTTASGIADKAFVAGTTVLEVKEIAETSYSTVEKVLGGPGNPVLNHGCSSRSSSTSSKKPARWTRNA
jgi:hypothetical protein